MGDYLKTYREEIIPAMMKRFDYKNPMQVPRLLKIVVNKGIGSAHSNSKLLDEALAELATITGQAPVVTRARKSIASFKIRAGFTVGCRVTLHRKRMYEFLDRLINVAIPRIRDFRGLPRKGFDGRGNYTLGIKEQVIFPEIPYDQITYVSGMSIAFVTNAKTDEEALALMEAFGMPFVKAQEAS
jgi:large subunit ribosomal protein L5